MESIIHLTELSPRFVMVSITLLGLMTALTSAIGSDVYPENVYLERTDSAEFVSEPNVLRDVQKIALQRSKPYESKGERYFRYGSVPPGKLDCINDLHSASRNGEMRQDLPGSFVCENKTIFVIPTIKVQIGRFFNVSLDFFKIQNSTRLKLEQPDQFLTFEISPTGITFFSGLFLGSPGTSSSRLNIYSSGESPVYSVQILIIFEEKNLKDDMGQMVEFKIEMLRSVSLDTALRIRAIRCAARAIEVSPTTLYDVEFNNEIAGLTLKTRLQPPKTICAANSVQLGVVCEDPIKDMLLDVPDTNATDCTELAATAGKNQQPDPTGGEESDSDEKTSVVELDEPIVSSESIVTSSQSPSTAQPSQSSAAPRVQQTSSAPHVQQSSTAPRVQQSSSAPPVQQSSSAPRVQQSSSAPRVQQTSSASIAPARSTSPSVASSPSSSSRPTVINKQNSDPTTKPVKPQDDVGVQLQSSTPTQFYRSEPEQSREDAKLKSAFYGMSGLAALVIIVIFVFLFNKLAICKRKAGYDPVFIARHSNETSTFHDDSGYPKV